MKVMEEEKAVVVMIDGDGFVNFVSTAEEFCC